jgi:hypothetical protein
MRHICCYEIAMALFFLWPFLCFVRHRYIVLCHSYCIFGCTPPHFVSSKAGIYVRYIADFLKYFFSLASMFLMHFALTHPLSRFHQAFLSVFMGCRRLIRRSFCGDCARDSK